MLKLVKIRDKALETVNMIKDSNFYREIGKKGNDSHTQKGTRYKFTPEDSKKGGQTGKRTKFPKKMHLGPFVLDNDEKTVDTITRRVAQ